MNRLLAFLLLAAPAAWAQSDKPPLTPAEMTALARKSVALPERSAWRVDFGKTGGAAGAFGGWDVQSIASARVGSTQRDAIIWGDGRVSEAWWIAGDYGAVDPATGNMLFTVARKPVGELGWISWISEKNCRGIVMFQGHPRIFFQADVPWLVYWPGYLTADAEGGSKLALGAYFSPEDGALVAISLGDRLAAFTWLEPPAGALAPGPEFAAQFQKIREKVSAKFRRAFSGRE